MPTIQSGGTLVLKHSVTAMGSTVVDHGATPQMAGGLGVVAAGVTLTNDGTITAQGGVTYYPHNGRGYGRTPAGNLLNKGVLVNQGQLAVDGGQGGVYNDQSGAVGATLTNTGVLVNIGGLSLGGASGGYSYYSGGGSGGLLLDQGTLANRGDLSVNGGQGARGFVFGFDRGGGGGDLSVTGSFSNSGVVTLGSGGYYYGFNSAGYGGSMQDSGVITNSGTIIVSAGIYVYGEGFARNSDAHFDVSGRLIDTGVIELGGGIYDGQLSIDAGATLSLLGAADIINQGILTNDGLISGHGTISGPTLNNNGTVLAIGGLLTIDGSIGGNGTFEVGAGGTLDINGVITEASTVPLTASAAAFAGMVGGVERFGAGGVVDPRDLLPTRGLGESESWHGAGGGAVLETWQTGAMGLAGAALDREGGARTGGHDGMVIGVHVQ